MAALRSTATLSSFVRFQSSASAVLLATSAVFDSITVSRIRRRFALSVEPVSVAAHGADPIGAGRACVAYLTLRLAGGAIAHIHVNWLSPTKVRTTMVGGSKRTVVWDDLNPAQRVAVFDRGVDMSAPEELGAQARQQMLVSYRSGDMTAPALTEREALGAMVEEYAAAIRDRRPALTDGRAGLRVLDILEAASRSLDFQGAVVGLRGTR